VVDEIRKQVGRTPFTPFSIRTSDGHEYAVPTIDHIHVTPRGTRVIVIDDKDVVSVLPILHINGVIHQANGE
jgi:hypothetical protein